MYFIPEIQVTWMGPKKGKGRDKKGKGQKVKG